MSLIKKAFVFLFVAAVVISLFVDPREVVRYRLTITVQTPEGIRSGFSVIEARYDNREGPRLYPQAGRSYVTTGEAVYVDLGTGADGKPRQVIALLASGVWAEGVDWHRYMPWAIFLATGNVNAFSDRASLKGSVEIPLGPVRIALDYAPYLMPTLVTFKDISDPASAMIVAPTTDGFTAAFGPGYAFQKATVEILPSGSWPFNAYASLASSWMPEDMTGVAVTKGIKTKLAWWNRQSRPAATAARAAGLPLGAIDVESFFVRNF